MRTIHTQTHTCKADLLKLSHGSHVVLELVQAPER